MKYAKEFGCAGHMLPILITYMIIHHKWTYWGIILSMINPIHITYSPTYPSVETGDMHRYWQWQWQYCWEKLLLCSSSCKQICGTAHWYGQLRSSQMPYSSWCMAWEVSQRLGILRKSWRVFHERSLLGRCFRGFVLTVLDYCSAV